MYGATIPEDEDAEALVSKQPSKNQAPARGFGLVVALCVGVLIGALGTAMVLPASRPAFLTERTALDQMASDQLATPQQELVTCTGNHLEDGGVGGCKGSTAELAPERRAAMELDAQSECQAALLKYLEGSDYRTGFLSPGDCVHISKSCRCLNQ